MIQAIEPYDLEERNAWTKQETESRIGGFNSSNL